MGKNALQQLCNASRTNTQHAIVTANYKAMKYNFFCSVFSLLILNLQQKKYYRFERRGKDK